MDPGGTRLRGNQKRTGDDPVKVGPVEVFFNRRGALIEATRAYLRSPEVSESVARMARSEVKNYLAELAEEAEIPFGGAAEFLRVVTSGANREDRLRLRARGQPGNSQPAPAAGRALDAVSAHRRALDRDRRRNDLRHLRPGPDHHQDLRGRGVVMPQFQIQTPNGYNFQIHSSDRETVGRWFAEMAARFASDPPMQADYYLRIWPMFLPDPETGKDRPDWCANSTHWWCHEMTFDGTMQSLVSVLTETIEKEPER